MDERGGDASESETGHWGVKKTLAFPANRSIFGASEEANAAPTSLRYSVLACSQ